MPQTVIDLGRAVKAKYPGQYDDLTDDDVGRKVKAKFPGAYDDYIETAAPSVGQTLLQEAVVNPAKQVAAGAVGASATANRMTANIADKLDWAADQISNITGLPKGGLFRNISDWARGQQHQQEQQAAQLSGQRTDLASQLYRGGTQGVLELPTYAVASHVLGPTAGMAAVGAIRESDRGWPTALQAAAEGALMGKALEVMGPASRPIRLTGAGAMAYATARLNGADNTTALANATTMGAMAGFAPGGMTARDIAKLNVPDRPILKSTLNPVEAQAVEGLKAAGVPMTASVQTGNRFARAAEGVVEATPLGSVRAAEFRKGTEEALQNLGQGLIEEASPEAVQTPQSAGLAVRQGLDQKIAGFQETRNAGYDRAWKGRGKPEFTETLPLRLDNDGGVIEGPVNMPVDVRDIKAQADALREELSWDLSHSEQSQSKAFNAAEKLLSGDDYIPAWQAERGLSALKSLARTTNKTGVRDFGQGAAANLIPQLQEGIDAAVAKAGGEDALDGLRTGREEHAKMMDVVDKAEKLPAEPVQAFGRLVWPHDSGIDYTRKIAFDAPDAMPKIGRAFVQNLFDRATREGGIARAKETLNTWRDLGPDTKEILFPDAGLRAKLDSFFKGLDMVVQKANTSGTEITRQATSTNPLRWLAGYAGSKILYTPEGISFLTQSLKDRMINGPAPIVSAPGKTPAQAVAQFAAAKAGGTGTPPATGAPNVGDPVTWTVNGETRTGTVKSQGGEGQFAPEGHVEVTLPNGKSQVVRTGDLRPVSQTPPATGGAAAAVPTKDLKTPADAEQVFERLRETKRKSKGQ